MIFTNYKSIATVSLSGSLIEKLEAISGAGFDGVEICENDVLSFNGTPEQVKKVADELGLKILLFQPFRNFEGAPREKLKENLEKAKQKFDLMTRLGVSLMLVCSNVMPNAILNNKVIIDDLGLLAVCAAQFGIKIGYEALSWGTHVNSYRHAWKVVQSVASPMLGLILDSFHILATKDSLSDLDIIPAEKIFFVQLADAKESGMNLLEWSRHFRCYPGHGDFDVEDFVSRILKRGYSGPLSLEIFSDSLKSKAPKIAAYEGIKSMTHLAEKLSNHYV